MTLEMGIKSFEKWIKRFENNYEGRVSVYITEYGEDNPEMERTDDVIAFLVIPQRSSA